MGCPRLSWIPKDESALDGVSTGLFEKANAIVVWYCGSMAVTPISSSPHAEQPLQEAVSCQWVALTWVPVFNTVY